ncbi:flagellar hook-associated protein FlgK [Fredinandcohnia quinoae]|uniref:Flagellar hook-associated protein 1 n=1 Tax=Fredinandcohnia quinoae TaxID=2918902 RepID=A0AAW5DXJ6_9BACI|nr:flagellar hook-associated protein FlgK [Fredinandcohnia sp. SECRCQ15]MCH1625073.1 flagellar hook-associated protein FlgK [Fredinandcohnia sp. SECRCQ15]
MTSTFHGLETARRGMVTQQAALYVTGHNIANTNTPGYSRQRVNFETTIPFPGVGMNAPKIPGHLGTGVTAGSIQRIRDEFADRQYRDENNKFGYWNSRAESLARMEEIMHEPSTEGLTASLDEFWKKLQDLAGSPDNTGARDIVLMQGQAVADSFKYISDSLNTVRDNLKSEIDLTKSTINSIAAQINGLNRQIGEIEPNGYVPNDLYDERDRLVDQLSELVNVKITVNLSGGNRDEIAIGKYTIDILDNNGTPIANLVDGVNYTANEIDYTTNANGYVDGITFVNAPGTTHPIDSFSNGKLKGLIDSYGYVDNAGNEVGEYPNTLENLDKLALAFVNEFNAVHRNGSGLNGSTGLDFFTPIANQKGAAANIKVAITDKNDIAASDITKGPGDGSNAYKLSEVITKDFGSYISTPSAGLSGSVKDFYTGMIGTLGVAARETNLRLSQVNYTKESVEFRRQSVMAVSLDEEMTNIIKFQHAYNAAARNITIIDEMLDKIVNGLGTGGR